jgi:translation initiation factor IF-2
MSVRIHQLSKDIGVDNKELIELLRKRGYEVKSASSTIDNISAASLVEEFAGKQGEQPSQAPAEEQPKAGATPESTEAPAAKGPNIPSGAIVRTRAEIEEEKRRKAEEERKAQEERDKAPEAPPRPAQPQPKSPPPPPSGGARPPQSPPRSGAGSQPPQPPRSPQRGSGAGNVTFPGVRPAASERAPSQPSRPPQRPGSQPPKPPAGAPPRAASGTKAPTPPPPPSKMPPKPPAPDGGAKSSATTPPAAVDPAELKPLHTKPPIVVRDFAVSIGIKPFKLISELMEMGIFASMNQTIEADVAARVAADHGFRLEVHHRGEQQPKKKAEEEPQLDESALLEPRPPVVCILGHVDHGKTTLLDTIRKADVAKGEAGGITQHVGAYQIEHGGNKLTFIDTPGHAAFSKMRERGVGVTDVSVLVVAADDGFMPQTDEALKFAQRTQGTIVVAINKSDVKGADINRVKRQMQERGIPPEDLGGEIVTVPISALKGDGIDELLEMIQLQADVMELQANPKCAAEGVVVESQIEQGRGPTATVIVQRGTMKKGDAIVCGNQYCRVRAMMDDTGAQLKQATPGTPVRIIGWSDAPMAGQKFETVKNEREAKRITEERAHEEKMAAAQPKEGPKPTSIEDLFGAIEATEKKSLAVILRADVHGSLEALESSLRDLPQDKVELRILQKDVGQITKNDVNLASTSGATIVGFNTKLENGVQGLAKHHNVTIYQHNIIYEIIDIVRDAMADQLDPELRENKLGAAEIRAIFPLGKSQKIAGCMVIEGKIVRDRKARVMRGGEMIAEGTINSLRRVKEDVKEVRAGFECGAHVSNFDGYNEGDTIECFEIEKIRPSL